MTRWLRPAHALLDRLSIAGQVLAVAVVLCLPLTVVLVSYVTTMQASVSFSVQERVGTAYLADLVPALTAASAGDEQGTRAALAEVRQRSRDDGDALELSAELDAAEAGVATPEAVANVAAVISAVGDRSNLILDPDLDSFYVMDSLVVQLPTTLVNAPQAATDVVAEARATAALANIDSGVGKALDASDDSALAGDLAGLKSLSETKLDATTPAALASDARTAAGPAVAALDRLIADRIALMQSAQRRALLAVGLALTVAAYLVVALAIRLRRSADALQSSLGALAAGRLEAPVPVPGRDELAAMSKSLAASVTALSDLVVGLRTDVDTTSATATQLGAMSSTLLGDARRADDLVVAASDSAARVSETIDGIAAAAEEFRVTAAGIGESVDTVAGLTEQTRGAAEAAESVVAALLEDQRRISESMGAISAIASQTRLLSLNATIEAARAGELGRGFAVVASEVRMLAGRVAELASEVGEIVGSTGARVESASSAMREVVALSESVAAQQRHLSDSSGQQLLVSEEIARSIAMVSTEAAGIAQDTATVAEATRTASVTAGELEAAGGVLQNSSRRLAERAERFVTT